MGIFHNDVTLVSVEIPMVTMFYLDHFYVMSAWAIDLQKYSKSWIGKLSVDLPSIDHSLTLATPTVNSNTFFLHC